MPKFEVCQYVVHIETWEVEAEDAEEAKEQILSGHGNFLNSDFEDIANERGQDSIACVIELQPAPLFDTVIREKRFP